MSSVGLGQNMTDKFYVVFLSGLKINTSIYAVPNTIFRWEDAGSSWIMCPETYYRYLQWMETVPPLLRELV